MFLPIFTVHLSQTESIFGYIKLKIVKGKNSLFVQHMMTLTKCAKNTLLTRELSKLIKNQTKMPLGVTFWFPVYPTIWESTPHSTAQG